MTKLANGHVEVLCSFNFDEEGNPQVYSKAEDERNAMAIQYLVGHWAEAMEDMNAGSFQKKFK